LPSTIEQVHREMKDVAVLAIDIQEPRETVESWVRARNVSFRVLLDPDGRVTRDYGVTATPTVFLVARDGTVRGKALGTKPWTSEKGRALLRRLAQS
jgi:hypothetical protein